MAIPTAPLEGGGQPILFETVDSGGSNAAALQRGYNPVTQDSELVADLGVQPTSGPAVHGNRNATNTSALQVHPTDVRCAGMVIKAREANANDVWVGGSTVTADTTEATGGFRLAPGASVTWPCAYTGEVYIRWATYTAGDGVEWVAERLDAAV